MPRIAIWPPATGIRGFTLIEILVVLVIVALLAGLLLLNYGRSPLQQLEGETARLTTVLNFAAEEAIARGNELGFVLDAEGYRFIAWDPTERLWQPVAVAPLADYRFEADVQAELILLEEALDPTSRERIARSRERNQAGNGGSRARPQILLFSSGEMTPFSITLRGSNAAPVATVSSDGFNPVAWSIES